MFLFRCVFIPNLLIKGPPRTGKTTQVLSALRRAEAVYAYADFGMAPSLRHLILGIALGLKRAHIAYLSLQLEVLKAFPTKSNITNHKRPRVHTSEEDDAQFIDIRMRLLEEFGASLARLTSLTCDHVVHLEQLTVLLAQMAVPAFTMYNGEITDSPPRPVYLVLDAAEKLYLQAPKFIPALARVSQTLLKPVVLVLIKNGSSVLNGAELTGELPCLCVDFPQFSASQLASIILCKITHKNPNNPYIKPTSSTSSTPQFSQLNGASGSSSSSSITSSSSSTSISSGSVRFPLTHEAYPSAPDIPCEWLRSFVEYVVQALEHSSRDLLQLTRVVKLLLPLFLTTVRPYLEQKTAVMPSHILHGLRVALHQASSQLYQADFNDQDLQVFFPPPSLPLSANKEKVFDLPAIATAAATENRTRTIRIHANSKIAKAGKAKKRGGKEAILAEEIMEQNASDESINIPTAPTSTSPTVFENLPPAPMPDLATELSSPTRWLLLAAFLASYNPAQHDRAIFSVSKEGRKGSRRRSHMQKNTENVEVNHKTSTHKKQKVSQLLSGPKVFGVERLLAIFLAISAGTNNPAGYEVVEIDTIEHDISLLVSMGLLMSVGEDVACSSEGKASALRCLLDHAGALAIAAALDVDLSALLFE
jgi:hypothetical protein